MLARVLAGGEVLYPTIFTLRQILKRVKSESDTPRALDELWEHYNRCEISCNEYEALSRDLEE